MWYTIDNQREYALKYLIVVFQRPRAIPMIIGEIKRYLRDGNSLRVSRSIRDTAYRILKTREQLEAEDKEATIAKIAEAMQVREREVVYALDAISIPYRCLIPYIISRATR